MQELTGRSIGSANADIEDASLLPSSRIAMTAAQRELYFTNVLLGISEKLPTKIRGPYVTCVPWIAKFLMCLVVIAPYVYKAIAQIDAIIQKMPTRIIHAILGLGLCFFGGVFPFTIAAVEAWKLCGGDEAIEALQELRKDLVKLHEQYELDDGRDDDGDGIADVAQISSHDLIMRKTKLVLKTVKPDHIYTQITCLYTGWVGVVATLKIQFAKTIALGAAMGARMYLFLQTFLEPFLLQHVSEDYAEWVPFVIKTGSKALGVFIAWWVQRILSAFYSAVRGGHMAGKELVNFANDKSYLKSNDKDTYLDEVAGVIFGMLGLFFQVTFGFGVPFPLSLLAFPVRIAEGWIAWSINT